MGTYSDEDLSYVSRIFPEVKLIRSPELQRAVLEIWIDIWRESPWQRIEDCPKQPTRYSADVTMYDHARKVAQLAIAVTDELERQGSVSLDRDALIAAALILDASKLIEYDRDGESRRGKLYQHSAYVAHKAWSKGLSDEIVHMVISHTPESLVPPRTPEAITLAYVDLLATDLIRGYQRRIGHT